MLKRTTITALSALAIAGAGPAIAEAHATPNGLATVATTPESGADFDRRRQEAMQEFTDQAGTAALQGAAIGAGIGAVAGCVIGGAIAAPTVVLIPVGCLSGGVSLAAIGAAAGVLIVGGPVAVDKGAKVVQILVTPY